MALYLTSMIITVCYGNGNGYQLCQVCACFVDINTDNLLAACLLMTCMQTSIIYYTLYILCLTVAGTAPGSVCSWHTPD